MARTGKPAERHVEAVSRAIAVLDALADADGAMGTNEIARRTGISPSTVSRLASTLTAAKLLEHDGETGRYRLGVRLVQLGNAVASDLDVRERARPALERLAAATGETATLSLPAELEAVTVDFARSTASVQSVAQIGRPSVAHATATGKVMLAFGSTALPADPLHAYTTRTIVDRDALARVVGRVRTDGWAQAVGEREDDLNALAAPVLGPREELVAIVGLQGPASRLDRTALRAAVPFVRAAAASVSALMGGP